MKPLDLNTLLYLVGAISLLFALIMFLFYKLTPTIKGPLQWSLGSFLIVIGSLLFSMQHILPGFMVYVVSGSFAIMGTTYYWAGIRAYKDLQINRFILYGFVNLQFFLGSLFYLVLPMPNVRMIIYSVISVIIFSFIIREFIQPVVKNYRLAYILCTIVFGISGLTSIYRIVAIIILLPGDAHVPATAFLLFYFMTNITQALLLGAFLLLISLKISEKLELKVEAQRKFFSIIAHDLSSPVGLINMMLNNANEDQELQENQRIKIYKQIENLSSSTYHLLQNLLFWSRNQLEDLKPRFEEFDANKVIQETIDFLKQIAWSKDISIEYRCDESLYCYADKRMIETVIRNLISNAIKFSFGGGVIKVTGEISDKFVLVRVIDNGIGMSEETQKKLFVYKESASLAGTKGERGTGLGLMLCKEFVEGNNGTITILSKKNEGTEVTVKLPGA